MSDRHEKVVEMNKSRPFQWFVGGTKTCKLDGRQSSRSNEQQWNVTAGIIVIIFIIVIVVVVGVVKAVFILWLLWVLLLIVCQYE